MPEARTVTFAIKSIDEAKRIVTGMVYAPMVIDTTGEFMFPEDVELACHRFMQLDLSKVIDTQHNSVPNGCYPVENYIAKAGDTEYPEGAWVASVKVADDATWEKVQRGDLNGFSYECMVTIIPHVVEYLVTRDHVGVTEEDEGHTHIFFSQVNDQGRVAYGKTDDAAGHSHSIVCSSKTTTTQGHSHRFFI